ncbi:MAG: hypothetical protein U1F15_11155 [Burkholderiales bacterium]
MDAPVHVRQETDMASRYDFDEQGADRANSVRAVVATLCVLGLASIMWIHSGASVGPIDEAPPAAAPAAPQTGSLHAPTTDPSLPSLEATFSRTNATPADEAQAPTF